MLLLLNTNYGVFKEDFKSRLLLVQTLSFKAYKIYITVIKLHLLLKLCKNKVFDIPLIKATADTANKNKLYS